MEARGSGRPLRDLYCLQHGLFQAPTDRDQLRTAVRQVFGGQSWGGCCSDKLLDVLLEAGERSYLKQQLYWDFQLLDSDHDGYLSARDAELLLAQVPQARATGEAWQDFLRSRGPGVAWRDIEDWLFRASRLPVDGPRTGLRRGCHNEQGTSGRVSTPLYQWGVRSRVEHLLERWDSGGLATLLGEEPSGVLAALERKYRVLQRKLCAEMLQAHYGQPVWASLPQNVKEDKLSELELLVDFGLRTGSILPLSSLPGAQHNVRSRLQTLKSEADAARGDPPSAEGREAAQALQELRHRKQVETAATLAQRHLLVGSSPEASRRMLQLHAQTELLQQETSFQAALLVLELSLQERLWDSQPVGSEASHQELAQLRLAAGHRPEPAWRESKTVPGRSMMQVLLDRLLLQQERDRTCLVQFLLTLAAPETVHGRGHDEEQPTATLRAGCVEDASPALQEAIGQMLKLAQRRLEVAGRAEVSWQDCAIAVLVDLQQAQQEELSHTIDDLTGILSAREGEACPALYEKLLARLQEPPLMSLLRHLQPVPPQEQHPEETLPADVEASPGQEASLGDLEAFLWRRSKSLPFFEAPEPREQNVLCTESGLQRDAEAFEPQEARQPEDVQPQKWKQKPQSHQFEECPPEQEAAAKGARTAGLQSVKEWEESPSEGAMGAEIPQSQRSQLGESKALGLRDSQALQSHERKDPEAVGTPPLQQTGVPPSQRCRSPETPPLLWRLLWQKAKSFELILYPEEEEVPQNQKEKVLPLKAGIPADPQALRHGGESKVEIPQALVGQSNILVPAETQTLQPQGMRALGSSQDQEASQRKPGMVQSQETPPREPELPRPSGSTSQRKRKDPQLYQPRERKRTESLQTSETTLQKETWVPQPQERSRPESPPLLWGALGLKSKSFELRKPHALQTQELKGSRIVQPQERSQVEPEAYKPRGCQDPKTLPPPKLREVEVFQFQAQLLTDFQGFQYPQGRSPKILQAQDWPQGAHQITPQKLENQEIPHRALELPKGPEAFVQERRDLQDPQTYHGECLEICQAQETSRMVLRPHEHRHPESPPLLWRVLGLKAKSFELRKPRTFRAQELRLLKPAFLAQIMAQKEWQERKNLEASQAQIAPEMETGCLQHEECKRPGSPPLLWRVLGVKAKSFELRKPRVFQTQKLRYLEPAFLAERVAQNELCEQKNSEALRPCLGPPEMETGFLHPQEHRRSESPPLLWRVLGLKAKSFELRKPRRFQTHKLRYFEPAFLAERMAQTELEGRKNLPEAWQSQQAPEMETGFPQHEEHPESPPLLWRVLGLKAKSFELRKPRTFQTQDLRLLKPAFLPERNKEQKELRERKDSEAPEKAQLAPEMDMRFLQHEGRRSPETPPLLWWVLELTQQGMPLREPLVPPQPQETSNPPAPQPEGGLRMESEAQKPNEHTDHKSLNLQKPKGAETPQVQEEDFQHQGMMPTNALLQSQDRRGPEPSPSQRILPQVESLPPELSSTQGFQSQDSLRAESTHRNPKRRPQFQVPKEMGSVPMQETAQVQEGSPGEQKILGPKELRALKTSVPQEEEVGIGDPSKVSQPCVHQPLGQGQLGKMQPPPKSLKAQEISSRDPEDCGPPELRKSQTFPLKETPRTNLETLEKVKQDVYPAPEPSGKHRKTKDLLPPGRLTGKSKSVDLGELQALQLNELRGQVSPQAQGETKKGPHGFQAQEDPQMELGKAQGPKEGPQAFQCKEKGGPEVLQAQGAGAEMCPLQSTFELKSESLEPMEPLLSQTQELRKGMVLQLPVLPQMYTKNLELQGTVDPKPLCPQGQCCEAGNCCEFTVEEKPSEMHGILKRDPPASFTQGSSQLPAVLLRRSKSLDPQELSKPPQGSREPENPQAPRCPQECPQVLESRKPRAFPPQETGQGMRNPLRDTEVLKTESESPFRKDLSVPENAPSQEKRKGTKPGALSSEENNDIKIQRQKEIDATFPPPGTLQVKRTSLEVQGQSQGNQARLGSSDRKNSQHVFPLEETLQRQPEMLESMDHGQSPAQLPLGWKETKAVPPWGTLLEKSKSLDLGELQALQPEVLQELENAVLLRNKSSPKMLQTNLQHEREAQTYRGPVALPSKASQVQECPQMNREEPQLQEGRCCEAERLKQMEKEPLRGQELPRCKGKGLCSQERRDAQIFCPKECRELEVLQKSPQSEKELLHSQRAVQRKAGVVEPRGLMEPQLLDPQEKRDLESPPLLRYLLRKSKTLGPEGLMRRDVFQIHHCRRAEGSWSQVTWKLEPQSPQLQGPVGQESHHIQELSELKVLQDHDLLNAGGRPRNSSEPGNLGSHKEAHKVEVETTNGQNCPHVSQNLLQKQGSSSFVAPQLSLPQALPPRKVPQCGIKLLQELGRLHNELEALKPHELRDEGPLNPQEIREYMEPEKRVAVKPQRSLSPQTPQDQEGRGTEFHQPPPDLKTSDASVAPQGQQQTLPLSPNQQRDKGPCPAPEMLDQNVNSSMNAPERTALQAVPLQEGLPETSPNMPEARIPHVLQPQKCGEQKTQSFCTQESLQAGRKPIQAKETTAEKEPGIIKVQEEHPPMPQGALLWKSKSLDPQELSRTGNTQSQGPRGADGLHAKEVDLGMQQMPPSQDLLHGQPQALPPQVLFPKNEDMPTEQEVREPNLLLPQRGREPKLCQAEEGLQGKQEAPHLPELKDEKSCQPQKGQELQKEAETLGPRRLEGPRTSQSREWGVEEDPWSGEGPQLRALSAPGMCSLDLASAGWEQETGRHIMVTALSPPSPGRHGEELVWEPVDVSEGMSREPSMCTAQPGRPSGQPRPQCPLKKATQAGETEALVPLGQENEEARTWQPLPPRPPRREKAFIWLSRREKEEALQRLAELQAEGERRQQRDKERQILRFQERLSIAKHRKSEDDFLGGSPVDRWSPPTEPQGQDQAGQKTALKRHLEKVKRERTYVMQSKRERNTLRFKELVNPLVAHGEKSPEPGEG